VLRAAQEAQPLAVLLDHFLVPQRDLRMIADIIAVGIVIDKKEKIKLIKKRK
jgi:hypothetical protein